MKTKATKMGRMQTLLGIAGVMMTTYAGWAEETGALKGAPAVIAILEEAGRAVAPTPAAGNASPRQQFAAEVERFTAQSGAMTPEAAADAWLGLVDRFWALPQSAGEAEDAMPIRLRMVLDGQAGTADISLTQLFAAVPGPATWPVLQERTAVRKADDKTRIREAELRAFTLLLNRKWGDAATVLDGTMRPLPTDDEGMSKYRKEQLVKVRRSIERLAKGQKTTDTAADFERQLDAVKGVAVDEGLIVIPDLAVIVGTAEAARLIEKAVVIPNAQITVKAGAETRRLVKAAILRNIDKLTQPQWELVSGADAVEYYEAMVKRFPPGKAPEVSAEEGDSGGSENFVHVRSVSASAMRDDYARKSAGIAYLFGLLAAKRQDDAIRFAIAEKLEFNCVSWLRGDENRQPLPPATVFLFAQAFLQQKPDAEVWEALISAGMAVGRDADVEKMLAAPRLPLADPERQAKRELEIANGYFALDRLDDGLAIVRRVLGMESGAPGIRKERDKVEAVRQNAAQKMVDLGCLLERQELVDEGVGAILTMLRTAAESSGRGESVDSYEWNPTLDKLIASGRYRQAEALAIELLRMTVRPSAAPRRDYWNRRATGVGPLTALARMYGKAGRHADLLTLLEKAPWWGVDDLLRVTGSCYSSNTNPRLLFATAAALLAEGRADEARRVAKTSLMLHPGEDDGYAVLLSAGDPAMIEWLDTLYARDRFEERPLIWKAVFLLKAGQAEKAEQAIREALKVDPTDGETRAGDRVRAYAVLADVLEARGKKDDAALFRNVVAAVRLAEKGDTMTEAGLLRRSLSFYDQAAVLFSDAYCVQWRLAERLYATGHPEEAEKHYAIVFERMPEQFGRVASLCFGCEGVFDRVESRSVAERILTRLAATPTARPQVFFLLGQLRKAQGHYPEAYAAFRKAVTIDPDYLDGWRQIAEIVEEIAVPQSERDEIYLRMLRLDPLGAHASVNLAQVTDLKGVWDAVTANQALAWEPPRQLFPFPASKALLEQRQKAASAADMMESRFGIYDSSSRHRIQKPGEAVVACSVIAGMLEAFENLAR